MEIKKRTDLAKLIDSLGLKTGVEIGVHQGGFSKYLLENTHLETLWSIDGWTDDTGETGSVFREWAIRQSPLEENERMAREALAPFGSRSKVIKSLSPKAADCFKNDELDFIYIDASHRFCGVVKDLMAWWPKLKDGGIFAGHDYWKAWRCEVMEAVNGFMVENKLIMHLTTDDENSRGRTFFPATWWTIKEHLTKKDYLRRLPGSIAELVAAKNRLKERGVTVVLPYQYMDQGMSGEGM